KPEPKKQPSSSAKRTSMRADSPWLASRPRTLPHARVGLLSPPMQRAHRAISSTFGAALIAIAACEQRTPASPPQPPSPAAAPGSPLTRASLVAMINEPDDFARARKFGELLPTPGPESLPVVKEALEAAAAT